jgi:hypothetical protein
MMNSRILGAMICGLMLCHSPVFSGQSKTVTLIVKCDKDAEVTINYRRTKTTGTIRQYTVCFDPGTYRVCIVEPKKNEKKEPEIRIGWFTIGKPSPQIVAWDSCQTVPKTTKPATSKTTQEACANGNQHQNSVKPAAIYAWSSKQRYTKHGNAGFKPDGVMDLTNGAIQQHGFDRELLNACKKTNQLGLEVALTSASDNQSGPARIVSFSKNTNERNFTLGQEGKKLVLRLRTSKNGLNGTNDEIDVAHVEAGKRIHVIVTYFRGKTVCYVNGKKHIINFDVSGDFSNWEPMQLIFGDEVTGDRNWNGTLSRVRIDSQFISQAEATERYAKFKKK